MAYLHNGLKFQVFRSTARRLALEAFSRDDSIVKSGLDVTPLRLEPITRAAIDASINWAGGHFEFPWERVAEWKARDSKAFDLALWYGTELCGLCYASPRQSTVRIKILLVEANPTQEHPLKGYVLGLSVMAITNYASALGLTLVEVDEPLQGAVPWYFAMGFSYDSHGHLVLKVADA